VTARTNPVEIFRKLITEPGYYVFMAAILAFFYFAFDKNFANVFYIFLGVSAFAYIFRSKLGQKVSINSVSGNSGKAFIQGLVATVLFLVVSFLIIKVLQGGGVVTLQSVLDRLSQTAIGATGTPILSGNPFVTLLVGSIIIPLIETQTIFVAIPQFLANAFNITVNLGSLETWLLMAVVSGIFVFYHVEAKNISDNVQYALTFVFGMFQSWLVFKFREAESAIYMHIQNNFLGLIRTLFLKPLGM